MSFSKFFSFVVSASSDGCLNISNSQRCMARATAPTINCHYKLSHTPSGFLAFNEKVPSGVFAALT